MKSWISVLSLSLAGVLACLPLDAFAAEKGGGKSKKNTVTSVDKKGREHSVKGYVPMKAAPGSKKFQAPEKIAKTDLPKKVDLRAHMTKIEDQGATSSCVANALAGAYEYWVKRDSQQDYDVSRLFMYYNARWRNGDQNEDGGSVIQLAMEALKELGACAEKTWPFEKPLLLEKPNRTAYEEASQFKIKEMQQVPLELEAWKQALASGYPVVFGCLLFDSFDECNQRGGVVPMPSPKDVGRSSHGGHSMCAVGYSDSEKVFIVRNSWGDQWGDKGYCYMPYNYLMNPEFNGGDSWVFIPETPLVDPEDTWFDDDEPVTDDGRGVDFVINPFTVDDYEDVDLDWWDESTVEYSDESDDGYAEYVEYAEEENWGSMEEFDTEEVIEAWEEENPDEDTSLYGPDEEEEDDDGEYDDSDDAEDEEDDGEYDDSDDAEEEDDGEYDEDAEEDDSDDGEYEDEEAEDEEDDGEYDDSDDAEDDGDDGEYDDSDDAEEEDDGEYDEDAEEDDSDDGEYEDEEAEDEEDDGEYDDSDDAEDEEDDGEYDDSGDEEEDDGDYGESEDEDSYEDDDGGDDSGDEDDE